jgi:hypothetical protein
MWTRQLGKRLPGTAGALTASLLAEADAGALPRLLGRDGTILGLRAGVE